MRIFLTILYALSFCLPAYALAAAYLRARKKAVRYKKNVVRRNDVLARFDTERSAAEALEEQSKLATVESIRVDLLHRSIKAMNDIGQKETEALDAEGIRVGVTWAEFGKEIEDVFAGRPKEQHFLARTEIIFIGVGVALSTAASAWSLWI